MVWYILLLIVSLAGVVKSADWFLKAAEVIGKHFKLPPFVLGVLLVGFGTSLPELATSLGSVIGGTNNVTIANIIGSNMANILLILGISTFFLGTIKFKKNLIDLDLPHLFCISILFAILIFDGDLSRSDGAVLTSGFLIYLLYSLTQKLPAGQLGLIPAARALFKQKAAARKSKLKTKPSGGLLKHIGLAAVSAIILAVAARFAVVSVLEIAAQVGWAVEVVTFVTIALGTSLPEILVSFKALRKGQGDLVLGNIIGSSVFNILLVGGLVSLVHPQFIDTGVLGWSIVGLVIAALVAILNGITKEIHAWEGAVFIMLYAALISKIIA